MKAKTKADRAERAKAIARLVEQGQTLRRIGEQFGISHERVRQICEAHRIGPRPRRAIERMRASLERSRVLRAKQVKTGYGTAFECASHVLREFHFWLVKHERHLTFRRRSGAGSHSIETVAVECYRPLKPDLSVRPSTRTTTNQIKESCLRAKAISVVKRPTAWVFTFLNFVS